MLKHVWHGILVASLVGACSGDDAGHEGPNHEGPMEKAGKKMDKMTEKAGDALSGAYLHAKVRGKLLDGIGGDALRINIDVEGDHVTLAGTVRERATRELAKELVENMEGVKTVESTLKHEPGGSDDPGIADEAGAELADAVLGTKVRLALLDKLGTDALTIDIDVADGKVVLSGTLPTDAKSGAATDAARAVEGVKDVENDLRSAK